MDVILMKGEVEIFRFNYNVGYANKNFGYSMVRGHAP